MKDWASPSAEPGGEGSNRAAEAYADDLVHLPPSRAGEGQAIWIPREAPDAFQAMKATLMVTKLKKALAEGRSVWVIVEQ